jgi:hypothetical protein
MPSFDILEDYARKVEDEMSAAARKDEGPPKTKKCPVCTTECPLGAKTCEVCGHEFPQPAPRFKPCPDCGGLNMLSAKTCQHCGASFGTDFKLTLDEALRAGAIVRGIDIDEDAVQEGEAMADGFRRDAVASGDAKIIDMIRKFPEESWGRIWQLMEKHQGKKPDAQE